MEHGVERLAVDVELQLVGGAVADPDRPRPAPALQVAEGLLGQIGGAVHPVHDLQRPRAVARLLGDPLPQPVAERAGLLAVAQAEQGVDGERGVPDPGVPVVPVALAADLLGQPHGGGGDRRPGRGVGHQLERYRGPAHHLPPAAGVGGAVDPVPPGVGGVVGQPRQFRRRQPPGLAAAGLDHHAGGLALLQRPGGLQPLAVPLELGHVALVPARGAPPIVCRVSS